MCFFFASVVSLLYFFSFKISKINGVDHVVLIVLLTDLWNTSTEYQNKIIQHTTNFKTCSTKVSRQAPSVWCDTFHDTSVYYKPHTHTIHALHACVHTPSKSKGGDNCDEMIRHGNYMALVMNATQRKSQYVPGISKTKLEDGCQNHFGHSVTKHVILTNKLTKMLQLNSCTGDFVHQVSEFSCQKS